MKLYVYELKDDYWAFYANSNRRAICVFNNHYKTNVSMFNRLMEFKDIDSFEVWCKIKNRLLYE